MSVVRMALREAGVAAAQFLQDVVTSEAEESGGVIKVPEWHVVHPIPQNIPFRVEVARYLLDLALHYEARPPEGGAAG